jgi:molecular chaperone DnaK
LVEAKNELDTIAYSLEKAVTDAGDKLSDSEKQLANDEVKRAREAIESGDLNRINAAKESVTKLASEIGTKIYSQGGAPGPEGPSGNNGAGDSANKSQADGEKVVDADYTVVDDEKK